MFYRALREDPTVQAPVLQVLVCPEHLQPLAEFHSLEARARPKCSLRNSSQRSRELNTFEPTHAKRANTDLLEAFREPYTFKVLALVESIFFYYLQRWGKAYGL